LSGGTAGHKVRQLPLFYYYGIEHFLQKHLFFEEKQQKPLFWQWICATMNSYFPVRLRQTTIGRGEK
jgi:hypothetical protein